MIDDQTQILHEAGLIVSHTIRWRDARNMLLREANEWNANLIFMVARGLSRLQRFLVGSVSSSVAARVHYLVEVVRQASNTNSNESRINVAEQ